MFRGGVVLARESRFRDAEGELAEKIIRGQESLDAVMFGSRVIDEQRGWRPLRSEPFAEPAEFVALLLDVDANGEAPFDELNDPRSGYTSASSRTAA